MRSDQVAQGFIQLGLEHLSGWRLHNLSGQLDPIVYYPKGGKAFPYIMRQIEEYSLKDF